MTVDQDRKISVLFVCMGNICRSPTADVVFKHIVRQAGLEQEIFVDSAGTHAYHIGDPPDRRAQNLALKRGYSMHELRARKIAVSDFTDFHYILAMDYENLTNLQRRCPDQYSGKPELFMSYSKGLYSDQEIPDPYFGGDQDFEQVLDMIEEASQYLLEHICRQKV